MGAILEECRADVAEIAKFAAGMKKLKAWLSAFRLRTLPLSFSSVILGSLLAAFKDSFSLSILIWALLTTLFLQILSNLANDYGDGLSGVDNDARLGPKRTIQSGEISLYEMRVAIVLFSLLSLGSGIYLLEKASKNLGSLTTLGFLILGILAIAAAIKYTMGKNPYGYKGFGDLAVFIFFGIAGVAGTYFLHTGYIAWPEFLPAMAIGFLAVGVLNLNNLRDFENDQASGKRSLVVIMGIRNARIYHTFLIFGALAAAVGYTLLHFTSVYQLLYLLVVPLLINNVKVVWKSSRSSEIDAELKKLAISTLIFALTMGIGLIY
jgi:1,4-dihydroxy-2-naphthoate octaprenyltransferase